MRIVAIVGGLVIGLLGLFMSVCGGGFLVTLGYGILQHMFGTERDPSAINGLILLLPPAGSLVLGIFVCRAAYLALRKNLGDK